MPLIEALNGVRPATSGYVRINNLDLYRNLDSLKQSIGYVPQEDIIHQELSVFRTLYYVAKLRLPSDVSRKEIVSIIEEVLDVTGLSERRNVAVSDLSGGQRKRVSMAVELITKPSVIFLDEPTSGLDPATEDKIMKLFRQIAESGRTVIMTTHAMENVGLFDKIVVLMRGKLVFFGTPNDALKHLGASSFKQLYDRLETPVSDGRVKTNSVSSEVIAEEWKQRYLKTSQYSELIKKPLSEIRSFSSSGRRSRSRLGLFGSVRQFFDLSRRYFEVLLRDKLNLAILFLQAPIIALMTFLVIGAKSPRDFVYFVLSLVSIWFGTSVSAREIIRERPVYRRERMFNLGIIPYLASKFFVLGVIVFIQCLMFFVPLKFFDLIGAMLMPGELLGIPQFWTMLLTASVGMALGLLISALFKTQEIATSLVPLILIPQILFSGLVGVPQGINKVIGLTMPSAWSFDTMKRFSTLETLEPEGAMPGDSTKGLGLYKFIEKENDETLKKAERDLADYKQMSGGASPVDEQGNPTPLAERLKVPEIKRIPDDLSGYVTFMHPWMNEVLNQLVLMLMFWILVFFTLIVLKLRDAR
ncbi:ATP-binding cassette domain-containing protein [Leptolyngbya sp. 7M]|uniref:ABC transporter ATP-binding protein/permease n=1 Tax=Leptolyngbya sp. 7M TaxID=2812896 RepID=UPI001B8CD3FA|nr:ATP-binding cassette domain-containing protein [Leptolyngbya sp. 7M]QYO66989.1 ATP-binding cassette domain-containing protein [Leptolyngbya sp. 7M]